MSYPYKSGHITLYSNGDSRAIYNGHVKWFLHKGNNEKRAKIFILKNKIAQKRIDTMS